MRPVLAASLPLSKTSPERNVLSGATMGTRYSAVFYADMPVDRAALQAELQAAVDTVDLQMSPWKPGSDLNRFNRERPGAWVELPEEMFEVVHAALRISIDSGGAFDPFVGELVAAWGFGPDVPSGDMAHLRRLQENWGGQERQVELDREAKRLRRLSANRLDLCGIAKGYGVDALGNVLTRWGLTDHLVSIDGEVRAAGRKPAGTPRRVALERPQEGVRDSDFALELADTAIATSGCYRQMRSIAGRTVSHTMHPQHGAPVSNGLLSVSVLAGTCMVADAWATALMVLGLEKGLVMVRDAGLDAIFVFETGSGRVEMASTDPTLLPAGPETPSI